MQRGWFAGLVALAVGACGAGEPKPKPPAPAPALAPAPAPAPVATSKPPPSLPAPEPEPPRPKAPPTVPGQVPLTAAEADRLAARALQMLRELSSRLQMAGKDCKRVAAELHLWINTYGAELRAMSRRTKSQSTTEVFKHRKAEFEQLTKLFMQQLMTCAADPAVRAAIERMGQVVR